MSSQPLSTPTAYNTQPKSVLAVTVKWSITQPIRSSGGAQMAQWLCSRDANTTTNFTTNVEKKTYNVKPDIKHRYAVNTELSSGMRGVQITYVARVKASNKDMPMITEHVKLDHDFIICICGNEPYINGFYPCLDNGLVVEPIVGGEWNEQLYYCEQCHRIIDTTTGDVAGVAGNEIIKINDEREF
jgi:hypothetical protein